MAIETVLTKYGTLQGIVLADYFPDGALSECTLNYPNPIRTALGELIPQYADGGARRKHTRSLSFFPNGDLKSIALHDPTRIPTPVGEVPAELVTFYEGERVCRVFPLNGKITGFWSEADEYKLAPRLTLQFPVVEVDRKILSLHFYRSGAVQSVTIWPQDSLTVRSPIGEIPARIGFSLYEDGGLQSVEPLSPLLVQTPIGRITAYDLNANGMAADVNSLTFWPDGAVKSLLTSGNRFVITDGAGTQVGHAPKMVPAMCSDDRLEPVPLRIEFGGDGMVCFDRRWRYELTEHRFEIQTLTLEADRHCDACSGYDEG